RLSDQAEDAPGVDLERHPVHRVGLRPVEAEAHVEPAHLEQRHQGVRAAAASSGIVRGAAGGEKRAGSTGAFGSAASYATRTAVPRPGAATSSRWGKPSR